ncbi:hypothetical protein AWU67_03120 [Microterricola viridarii]|uniref:Uncharacterized protein n=1 Tax=Microterricola viridarii TaxID=412690 RepID=A0A120I0W3_9MICO|nr:hypothetical protein AWU67_03120 [Microterricola viridarii]
MAAATGQNYTAALRAGEPAELSDVRGFDEWCAIVSLDQPRKPEHALFFEWLTVHMDDYRESGDGFDYFHNRPATPAALSTSHNLCQNDYFEWIAKDGTFLGWASGSDDFAWNDDTQALSNVIFADDSEFPHTANYDRALAYLHSRGVKGHIIDSLEEQWMNWQMFLCIETNGYRSGKCKSDLGWDKALFVIDVPLPSLINEAGWLWAAGFVTAGAMSTDGFTNVREQNWRFALTREALAAEGTQMVFPALQLGNSSRERNTNWGGSGYVLATTWAPSQGKPWKHLSAG